MMTPPGADSGSGSTAVEFRKGSVTPDLSTLESTCLAAAGCSRSAPPDPGRGHPGSGAILAADLLDQDWGYLLFPEADLKNLGFGGKWNGY
ncbi:hypothetical protein OJ253_960 [Cryptosporidium canis]|uniref:Uncharacterized protein n=1 Tax=Cryptosporidium canis TaxID=195482 RepID=A0A9D5HVG6_9CRYT|nr:hypothetical protein OJ253_960 [Cryptosporidium canis]